MLIKSALTELNFISLNSTNPPRALSLMKAVIGLNIKLAKRTLTSNLLQNLLKKDLATNDAENTEMRLRRRINVIDKEFLKYIMKKKLNDALEDENEIRRKFHEAKKNVEEEVEFRSKEGKKFREIQKNAVNLTWEIGKREKEEKIRKIEKNIIQKEKAVISTFEGIKIGDKQLEVPKQPEEIIYGDIEVSENAREVLRMPPKFAVLENLDMEKIETEIEKCTAKLRMTLSNEASEEENETVTEIPNKNRVDFGSIRVTELPFVKRIKLPEPLDTDTEIKIQNIKSKLMNAAQEFIKEETDKKGNQIKKNLTDIQEKGLKEILDKKEKEDIVVFRTDKSNRHTLDRKENYKNAMKEHTEKDIKSSKKENLGLKS